MVAPKHMHMTITSTIALALASSAFATSCEGDPFVVQAGDSCSTYKNMCAGWTSVQCKGVGTTCTNGNDQLWTGDTCTFSYIGAASGRGLSSSSPDPSLSEQQQQPVYGTDKCTWGPSFWCASFENMAGCGAGAVEFCFRQVLSHLAKPIGGDPATWTPTTTTTEQPPLDGADRCTWGPSYWCQSHATMHECGLSSSDCDKYTSNN